VCCGKKRLVEIACPPDCAWLASAREHPPAVVIRRQQQDVGVLMEFLRDFNRGQSQLFLMIATFLVRYEPPELHALIDEDIVEAMSALAATYETASRGLIYEHRPASLAAERLVAALKPVLSEAGQGGGSPFERDLAVVLRRVEEAARTAGDDRRAFLDLLSRMIRTGEHDSAPDETKPPPRLIVP
jgi:hypothetical protein